MEDQKTDGSHLVISFRMINSLTVLCCYIKKKNLQISLSQFPLQLDEGGKSYHSTGK